MVLKQVKLPNNMGNIRIEVNGPVEEKMAERDIFAGLLEGTAKLLGGILVDTNVNAPTIAAKALTELAVRLLVENMKSKMEDK